MKNLINKDFIDANYHKHESTCVLFATHGLPESLEKKGDPAVKQMRQLIREIELELDPIKVYHGFLNDDFFPGQKWTSPAVLDLFNDIKNSCSNILIDSRVSFTTHNKATLYELKYLIEEILKKNPLPINIKFSDSLAKNKEFSKVMSEIVYDKIISLNSWQPLK